MITKCNKELQAKVEFLEAQLQQAQKHLETVEGTYKQRLSELELQQSLCTCNK
jgi:multidrug resistance efflux pump